MVTVYSSDVYSSDAYLMCTENHVYKTNLAPLLSSRVMQPAMSNLNPSLTNRLGGSAQINRLRPPASVVSWHTRG
jgi:hypothetical protein